MTHIPSAKSTTLLSNRKTAPVTGHQINLSKESPKNAGKPRRSRRGWIGVGRAGLNAQAANIFLCHSGALNGRWSGEDGNPGIHAGEDVHSMGVRCPSRVLPRDAKTAKWLPT